MPTALLTPGDSLGKYEIVRELAIGGMAAIYLARVRGTAGFEKNVVLKCILPNLAIDRDLVTMFLDEARLAATLRHSNIADVFDVGHEDKLYYFAMEYVHGENARTVRLHAKHKGAQIPFEVALATAQGTAGALAYAHDRTGPSGPLNIVHRDVSPSNILISYEGAVKLVDFGIARASSRSGGKTRTGMRKGKVPYMSPEQCRGRALDRRSDLFSLGTVLYELTTTVRPFRGNSDFEVMDAIVTGDPTPPSVLIPGYPRDLEEIIMRLLARAPESRYQDAQTLLEDLEAFAQKHGILTSAHVVAKFMRELFSEAPPTERDTYTGLTESPPPPSGARTREYPDGHPPEGVLAKSAAADDEPTGAFTRAEQLWTPELKVKVRTPRRLPTEPWLGDEPASPFAERTRQDVALPFDPIDARSAEILHEIDADAPPDESEDARAYRRVETLLDKALAWLGIGETDKAVAAIELALEEDTTSEAVQQLLQSHVDTIISVYEAMLEDPYRVPELTRPIPELVGVAMEQRTRLLLPWIDGTATIKEIIDRSGMQRLEVYHHLCQLQLRGILR